MKKKKNKQKKLARCGGGPGPRRVPQLAGQETLVLGNNLPSPEFMLSGRAEAGRWSS